MTDTNSRALEYVPFEHLAPLREYDQIVGVFTLDKDQEFQRLPEYAAHTWKYQVPAGRYALVRRVYVARDGRRSAYLRAALVSTRTTFYDRGAGEERGPTVHQPLWYHYEVQSLVDAGKIEMAEGWAMVDKQLTHCGEAVRLDGV